MILRRGIRESIVIDDHIRVTPIKVEQVGNDFIVHLRVSAPREIPVHREEIHRKIVSRQHNGGNAHNAKAAPEKA